MKLVFPLFIVGATMASVAMAEEHVVTQKNKAFSVSEITIKTGDSISFRNEDSIHHNVFSLSDAALFDLGSYDKGKAKSHTFDTPGEVHVECAIHPDMKMKVVVE